MKKKKEHRVLRHTFFSCIKQVMAKFRLMPGLVAYKNGEYLSKGTPHFIHSI